eukprot:1321393-Amorphochlora_amoeboformis.AAC.1
MVLPFSSSHPLLNAMRSLPPPVPSHLSFKPNECESNPPTQPRQITPETKLFIFKHWIPTVL